MQVTKFLIGLGIAMFALVGCSNGESLQRYLVDKQEDDNFVKVDVAASLLKTESNNLSQEELDEYLSRFYWNIRTKDGKKYHANINVYHSNCGWRL